jgi:hypothetical protein
MWNRHYEYLDWVNIYYLFSVLAGEINEFMRSEGLPAVNVKSNDLWDLTPYSLVDC